MTDIERPYIKYKIKDFENLINTSFHNNHILIFCNRYPQMRIQLTKLRQIFKRVNFTII